MTVRHATESGKQTLCGLYCGFHRPLKALLPVQGWGSVTCKNCQKVARAAARIEATS